MKVKSQNDVAKLMHIYFKIFSYSEIVTFLMNFLKSFISSEEIELQPETFKFRNWVKFCKTLKVMLELCLMLSVVNEVGRQANPLSDIFSQFSKLSV